ncbi:MAG: hypothetical protein ABIS50_27005 [Luteolibacter sp.]|uniref:hypothetical protein n=1 Tax=Luteolibacter sp. TaxID=1962973 RepID=UPI003263E0F9
MITIKRYALHVIPIDGSPPTAEPINIKGAVDDYVTQLLLYLSNESSTRNFGFPHDRSPESRTKMLEMLNDQQFDSATAVLATRLNEMQQKAKIGIITVTSGDLLSVVLEISGETYILLAKLEQLNFLSRQSWQKDAGFPFDKNRLLKTCLCKLTLTDQEWEFTEISIYDNNSSLSTFWWSDFLELVELTNDSSNSQRAYAAWKRMLEQRVKHVSESDYHILRNALGFHFKNTKSYVHKDLVDTLLGSYSASSPNLDIDKLKKAAQDLPKQSSLGKKFDERFELDPKACNIRLTPIRLTPEIDLVLKQPIEDLSSVIIPKVFNNKKGVFIVSSEGYDRLTP